jgi:DNA-binding response OmpR family regulator
MRPVLDDGSDRILIVEDDERIGSSLVRALDGSGYRVRLAQSGDQALRAVADERPDLVLLDLGLPDVDGLEVCRRLRDQDPSIAIVVLTARDEEIDVVVGLDSGAADYITKPFKLAELLARIRAQLRRSETADRRPTHPGGLALDLGARRVWLDGREIEMRAKEFDLLARLHRDVGKVVTREDLMSDVWDEHWFGSTKTLDFHIASLRRRLDAGQEASRISTVRGVGYRLEDE